MTDYDALMTALRDADPWRMPTPREELLYRLNARLKGEDPGPAYQWRGLAGAHS